MASPINLLIEPIQGFTPTERAEAISAELFNISRPITVRQPEEVSAYVFTYITHPTTGQCVMRGYSDYQIYVHPQNNLNNLIALMPNLSQAARDYLIDLIQTNPTITFGQLLTGAETILTDEQMQADGWFGEIQQ